MTDVTQGADAPDDAALFREATDSPTLEQFENPKLESPPPGDKPADKPPTEKPADKPADKPQEEPPIPAGRLREESEARRRAERERDELAARFAALSRPQQQQQPQKKPDVFEDPQAYVLSIVQPLLDRQAQERQLERENLSMERAQERFGHELVAHSRQALEHFMSRGDPMAWATYKRAMESHDPYGVIAGWFHERSLLHEVGGDLNAFRKREREAALKDPEHLKAAIELAKSQASANGSFVNQSVKSPVPNMPSLGNIGASGGDTSAVEPSDMELFRAATSAKRR
jgi:hypothetical protein